MEVRTSAAQIRQAAVEIRKAGEGTPDPAESCSGRTQRAGSEAASPVARLNGFRMQQEH